MNTNSPAYKKGYANSQLPHYWEHQFETDKLRYKSAKTREEFSRGYYDGLAEKYNIPRLNSSDEHKKQIVAYLKANDGAESQGVYRLTDEEISETADGIIEWHLEKGTEQEAISTCAMYGSDETEAKLFYKIVTS